ncbi:E3 ubiquitin-protein ligase MYLIP [Condylostylus longicornis]|uniref:E3 ubiquitin-protein ligase MYLIP n=1 Tax=Condylostylus longicornis TaxID=2530218 RepID=UPI00244DEC10|nr:E3 ubiquitin-protein ligase MYLIP [Condylostylus longicornis]
MDAAGMSVLRIFNVNANMLIKECVTHDYCCKVATTVFLLQKLYSNSVVQQIAQQCFIHSHYFLLYESKVQYDTLCVMNMSMVCKALNIICEMEYFGLEHWTPNQKETRTHQWINLRNRLSQDSGSSSSIQLMLAIRVKFWVPVHLILQESARNLFYMQAKVDLIEGRLLAKDWNNAAKLSALLCQADGIRFNEACLKAKCPQNLKTNIHQEQLNHKEKKEKEPVLAFKKRRLSKQKSVESFDMPTTTTTTATVAALTTAIALGNGTLQENTGTTGTTTATTTSSSQSSSSSSSSTSNNNNGTQQKQRPQLQRQSYSLGSTSASTSSSGSSIFSSILNSTSNINSTTSTSNTTINAASTSTTNNSSTSSSSSSSSTSASSTTNNGSSSHCLKNFPFCTSSTSTSSNLLTSSNSLLNQNNNNNNNNLSNNNNNSIINDEQNLQKQTENDEDDKNSPLRIYEDYLIQPTDLNSPYPDEFLRKIAIEHAKLAKLKMSPKSAKYWLLKEIQDLPGYGEEVFSGFTGNENSERCDVAVGAHGISVYKGGEKSSIPFSAIAAAKSLRRAFKLDYVNDHNERKELEIKLPKHCIAAGLYRSITERHAFYVCDKVRVVVTSQFTRDLKGTIASMFKEDTELGKRYVFDIQRTCREVHDQARRILYERGIEITATAGTTTTPNGLINGNNDIERYTIPSVDLINGKVDQAIKEKEEREATIERCVGSRITEAMTCKICMDREINSMFNPCGHVTACSNCAAKCERCPNCRIKIINVVKVFLPTELRNSTAKNHLQQQQQQQSLNDKHQGVLIEASN